MVRVPVSWAGKAIATNDEGYLGAHPSESFFRKRLDLKN